jgi:predicted MPP superfamily phosphohydrolase
MTHSIDRRQFLKLAGLGGAVLVSGWRSSNSIAAAADNDFYFVQLSDLHWGFEGPAQNPDNIGTLKKAIASVNSLKDPPDFIVFTGDLTHTTEDRDIRRKRMTEVRDIIKELKVKDIKYMPGEHDASLDKGRAFKEFFGETHWTFDHKGVHFIAIDNVSDPGASIGDEQLAWLKADLERQPKDARIVVFTHRPLFDLYPQWDWATADGAKAIEILQTRDNVTVFYGHIHQEHHFKTGAIEHHAAKGLMFALPAPGSQLKRTPVAWDPQTPYKGLGWREIEAEAKPVKYEITELPVVKA